MPAAKPAPPQKQLEDLYLVQGLSIYAVAKEYGVRPDTAKKWLREYAIPLRTKAEQFVLTEQKQRVAENDQNAQFEFVDEGKAEPSGGADDGGGQIGKTPALQIASPIGSAAYAEDEEVLTAFDRLSRRQQALAMAYADAVIANDGSTYQQIAERASSSHDTLERCLKDPTFQEAIRELTDPQFKFYGEIGMKQWVMERIKSGKIPQGELRVFAEMFGLVGGSGFSVNIGVQFVKKDKRIRGF